VAESRGGRGCCARVTEQQKYDVIERLGSVELRRYPPCVVADVVVRGTAEGAGNSAFRPLAGYISGNNTSSSKLAMTAPVLQEPAGQKLAMTAPVLQEAAGQDAWTVSFVLPGDRPLGEYPVPTDRHVTLREVPGQLAAALRWSGRWTQGNVENRTRELREAIAGAGWAEVGQARWARFDPPWRPAFVRRNEIVIPVAVPSGVGGVQDAA
jgi:hypothetical protein